jgi:hypothetical protein
VLGVLAGLAVLGEAADVGARHYATSRIEQRVRQQVPGASGVRARIRSWPFLKVAVSGDVDEIGVTLDRVVVRPVAFTAVDVDLVGVRISVSDLLTASGIQVTGIRRGTVSLAVTEGDLERAIADVVPGTSGPLGANPLLGRALVSVDAKQRLLVVSPRGLPSFTLPLPGANILPCTPAVRESAAEVALSCTFTHVPAAFTSVAT